MKNKPLIGVVAIVLLLVGAGAVLATSETTQDEVLSTVSNYLKSNPDKEVAMGLLKTAATLSTGGLLGGAFTTGGSNLTDVRVENLIVSGDVTTTNFSASGITSFSGTSTLGYTPNQLNVPQVAFNGNSTTLCSVQNTSGVNRIISDFTFSISSTTGDGVGTSWRAYVSAGRADNNTAGSSTLFSQTALPIVNKTSGLRAYGGPVPGSYYVSSTANPPLTGVSGLSTSTPVVWFNGWYANMTSTAITSSTGNCIFGSYPL